MPVGDGSKWAFPVREVKPAAQPDNPFNPQNYLLQFPDPSESQQLLLAGELREYSYNAPQKITKLAFYVPANVVLTIYTGNKIWMYSKGGEEGSLDFPNGYDIASLKITVKNNTISQAQFRVILEG
jgi:hypothetical protein